VRLVATEYVSLDGVFEEPGQWSFPFFDEEAGQFKWQELQACDALLLGRKTYEGFAAAWPTMTDTGEFGVRMNEIPKYVVSSTLDPPAWTGSRLIRGDIVAEIAALRRAPGRLASRSWPELGPRRLSRPPNRRRREGLTGGRS